MNFFKSIPAKIFIICLFSCILQLMSGGQDLFARSPFKAERRIKIAVLGIGFNQISSQDSVMIYQSMLDSLAGRKDVVLVDQTQLKLKQEGLEFANDADLLMMARALSADYLITGKFDNIAEFVRIKLQLNSIQTDSVNRFETGCVMDTDLIIRNRLPRLLADIYDHIVWPSSPNPASIPYNYNKLFMVAGGIAAVSTVMLLVMHDDEGSRKALPRPPSF